MLVKNLAYCIATFMAMLARFAFVEPAHRAWGISWYQRRRDEAVWLHEVFKALCGVVFRQLKLELPFSRLFVSADITVR